MVTSSDLYPPGPSGVPADLTAASGAYRRRAWLAVAGLVVFLAAYLALAGWFGWTAYRLVRGIVSGRHDGLGYWAAAAGTTFLAVFMAKAFVFIRRGGADDAHELERRAHPRLFEFLDRLADDARAPRPHRVFLSPAVNAGVFYDLSVLNLILPSKKNLVIGLGLINVLDLSELKAVLAHEFGHFAQRSMAVGRWVYTAQQIAGHVVGKRDGLDRSLQWLSTFDLRVAWIGWTLRTIVWSIRSLVETAFGWVVIAERALSREMELQADLVAVSLTGSDPLIDALHRLGTADDAMGRAVTFAGSRQRQRKRVADLFAIQTEMIARKREILGDPSWGTVLASTGDPAARRLFRAQLAQPPRMWASHPPSTMREDNAKRRYLSCARDPRSAWLLFEDPARVRTELTARMYAKEDQPSKLVPAEETTAALAESFARRYLDRRYRGVYLGRSVVRSAAKVDDLYGSEVPTPDVLPAALAALYPASLTADLQRLRELTEERVVLTALERGVLEAPGGVIRHRGQEVRRRALPGLIADVGRERAAAEQVVREHDRRVRTLHLAAARAVGPGWEAQLRGLAAMVHYAEHAAAELEDAFGAFRNVLAVALADRKVTTREAEQVVAAGTDVHGVLTAIHDQGGDVELGPTLRTNLEVDTWKLAMGTFDLAAPTRANLGRWLEVMTSWVDGTDRLMAALGNAALEELLRAEDQVAAAVSGAPEIVGDAPSPARPPAGYAVRLPGQERPRQTRLDWWGRFQIADGLVPAALRFVVAGGVVAAVIYASR